MRIYPEITTDFSLGMDDSSAATAFPTNAAQLIHNGRITPDGTVEMRPGSQRLHSTALNSGAQGFGGIEFRPASGSVQLVVFVGDTAYFSTDEGETWTAITGATGLTEDYWSLVTMRSGASNYLIAANGGTNTYKYDGTTWSAVANIPNGVKFLAVFNERLYAAGHDGSRVVASAIRDFETWATPDGLSLEIQTHDGDIVTGLYQIGPQLLVFKRNSTAWVDGFGNSDIVVAAGATGFSRSVGCIAFRSIAGAGDSSICWMSERGIERYRAGGGIELLSRRLQKFFEAIQWATVGGNPGTPVASFDPARQNYHLAVPSGVGSNDRTVVANLLLGALTIDKPQDADADITLGVDGDGYLIAGSGFYNVTGDEDGYLTLVTSGGGGEALTSDADGYLSEAFVESNPAVLFTADFGSSLSVLCSVGYDGFVRRHDAGILDNVASDGSGGTAIGFRLVSRPYLFRNPAHRKRARVVRVQAIANEAADVSVRVLGDGSPGNSHTLTIPATAFEQPKEKFARVSSRGHSLQVEVISSDSVRITAIEIGAELLQQVVG